MLGQIAGYAHDLLFQIVGYAQYLLWVVPAFIFVLGLVVFFHELGHFAVARWCGVKVETFSLGFGREIFAFHDRHGTRWRCAVIPIGGYVKFYGDLNGASVPDEAMQSAMSPEQRRVSFFSQQLWKRAAIVAAGPMASFLFAIVVFALTSYIKGERIVEPRVGAILGACMRPAGPVVTTFDRASLNRPLYANAAAFGVAQSAPAELAGFKKGDIVRSIDGQAVTAFSDIPEILATKGEEPLVIQILRDGKPMTLTATPRIRTSAELLGPTRRAQLGIVPSDDKKYIHVEMPNPLQAIVLGTKQTWEIIDQTVQFIGRMFVGRESADQLAGPIGIAKMAGAVAKIGFFYLFTLAGFLSASIGFFNLLPIPLLDGGHLLYFAVEGVRGRPLSLRAQEFGFKIGLALVALLMVFATSNDILKGFR